MITRTRSGQIQTDIDATRRLVTYVCYQTSESVELSQAIINDIHTPASFTSSSQCDGYIFQVASFLVTEAESECSMYSTSVFKRGLSFQSTLS